MRLLCGVDRFDANESCDFVRESVKPNHFLYVFCGFGGLKIHKVQFF